jgi:hypothetical protein
MNFCTNIKNALAYFLTMKTKVRIEPGVAFSQFFGVVATSVDPFSRQTFTVCQSSGGLAPGASLGLQVRGHGRVIVLSDLQVVAIGPGNGSPPISSTHFEDVKICNFKLEKKNEC